MVGGGVGTIGVMAVSEVLGVSGTTGGARTGEGATAVMAVPGIAWEGELGSVVVVFLPSIVG